MASGKAGIHVVQLKSIVVPDLLKEGYKFIKWDDDSTIGTPVTLKVDQYGFFLSWKDQHHETEFLEISSVRDVRTGREAKLPRDPKVRDSVTIGPDSVPLEEKTLTVVYGSDLVNVSFINFCCNSHDIAQLWATHTLKMAYNLLAANASSYTLLLKSHTRLTLMADAKGKIPVKHIFKMFVQHKDDKKRVDKALEAVGLPSGKNDKIPSSKLTIDTFFNFRKHLAPRPEVEAIFNQLIGAGDHSSHASSSSISSLPLSCPVCLLHPE